MKLMVFGNYAYSNSTALVRFSSENKKYIELATPAFL